MKEKIPFNKPYITGQEAKYIEATYISRQLSGDGVFTKRCHAWFDQYLSNVSTLLTHSCTAALEMAALLIDIEAGDEVIMPSYTFVSTANAFVMQGGVPVFVDIREDTLNLDERLIEAAITSRTKAIVPVHYAGVACEMDTIFSLAQQYDLRVIEDAAQGVMAYYKGRALGGLGDLGAYSFHETKNISSGEGGALLINNEVFNERAEIIREKGTNRSQFARGETCNYTWHAKGSSFLPSDVTAAFLLAQLEGAEEITQKRLKLWSYYHDKLALLEEKNMLSRMWVPTDCQHNAHIYYVILPKNINRKLIVDTLKASAIQVATHYVPLHSSPAGLRFGRPYGDLALTNSLSERIIRLPLWVGLTQSDQDYIIESLFYAIQFQRGLHYKCKSVAIP